MSLGWSGGGGGMTSPISPGPQVELVLANGRCLRFAPDLEAGMLVRLIRVVEAA